MKLSNLQDITYTVCHMLPYSLGNLPSLDLEMCWLAHMPDENIPKDLTIHDEPPYKAP